MQLYVNKNINMSQKTRAPHPLRLSEVKLGYRLAGMWIVFSLVGCAENSSEIEDGGLGTDSADGIAESQDTEPFIEKVDWDSLEDNGRELSTIWCSLAQYELENDFSVHPPSKLLLDKLFNEVFVNTVYDTMASFVNSKPDVAEGKIHVGTYFPKGERYDGMYEQIWCKMNTQEKINDHFRASELRFVGEPASCEEMNHRAFEWVFSHVTDQVLQDYEKVGVQVKFLPDKALEKGNDWVSSRFRLDRTDSNIKVFELQSTNLRTSNEWLFEQLNLDGKNYCKLLSPVGALQFVRDVLEQNKYSVPEGTWGFPVEKTEANQTEGFVYTAEVEGDNVDIYIPLMSSLTPLYSVVFLQGGKVDKRYYSRFSETLSGLGFIVAVANHSGVAGKNMTEQLVFNRVFNFLKTENQRSGSLLFERLDPAKVAVMGHSYGGLASFGIVQDKCSPPTCMGRYKAPEELSAVVLWGANNALPVVGIDLGPIENQATPMLYLQGDQDGMALLSQTATTYRNTVDGPKAMLVVKGANHYGVTNINNPPGADPEKSEPKLDQSIAIDAIGKWTGVFLRAELLGDIRASERIYGQRGVDSDPIVSLYAVEQ